MGIRSVFNVYILSRYLHVERINIKLLSLMLKTYAMCCYAGWDKKVSLFITAITFFSFYNFGHMYTTVYKKLATGGYIRVVSPLPPNANLCNYTTLILSRLSTVDLLLSY